tara:strand:+ start:292 stop:462 length:171 start_codon:yes stop_codon:yes gene_type:complete
MKEIEIKKLLETIKLKDLIQFKNRLIVQQTRNTQHATRNIVYRNQCDELLKTKKNI